MRSAATIGIGVALLAVAGPFGPRASAQGKVYFISGDWDIWRADLDGSNQEAVVTELSRPQCLAVDAAGGKMYWGDASIGKLQRANLNGLGVEDIGTASNPIAIDVDSVHGKVYWTDEGAVLRSDLDGANPEVVVDPGDAFGVAVDTVNNKVYWTEFVDLRIYRANLDGSYPEMLVYTPFSSDSPRRIVLDVAGDLMFWKSDSLWTTSEPKLWCRRLSGGNPVYLYGIGGGLGTIPDFAVDSSAGKLYWVEQRVAGPIYRRFDYNNFQTETLAPLEAYGIDLVLGWVPQLPGIPTVSAWGLVVMTILGVTAGTLLFRRRHHWSPQDA